MSKILMMKMFTKEDYISVYLPYYDVNINFLEYAYESKLGNKTTNINKKSIPGYREIKINHKNKYIGEFYIDERFNTITSKPSENNIYNKTYHYLKNKYNELKKSDFRYGDWEKNGISPTIIIFVEDFIDYLKEDIRDFKINKLLNEEK